MDADRLILVTGGTGSLGRRVVQKLAEEHRPVRVISRSAHRSRPGIEYVVGDLALDEGVGPALAGVDVVIHCAAQGKTEPDVAQARNLASAARRAGVRHLINISVVGADRIPVKSALDRAMFGYFLGQRLVEEVIEGSGVGWTNLRATQFHDGFILLMLDALQKMPVIPLPAGIRFQPVDADEVAQRLVELAGQEPAGQVPDSVGPRIYTSSELLQSYLRALGKRRLIVPMPVPGAAAKALRAGANLNPEGMVGGRSWEDFLQEWANSPGRTVRPALQD